MEEKKKITTGTLVRTLVLFLALVNQILQLAGYSVIPIDDEALTECITTAATVISAIIAWWKNNSFSQKAIKADEFLHSK